MKTRWFVMVAVLLVPGLVAAEEQPEVEAKLAPTLGVGARIGGYGFREVNGGTLSWDDCRMDGVGVFGTLDLGKHFFGELSADMYHATAGPVSHGMDRVSFLPTAAVGARMMPGKLISPYVQAGAGTEFTRIDLNGATDRKVLPIAYMGVGGEVNVKHFHFGMNIKAFSMGLPKHLHGVTEAHALEPEGATEGGSDHGASPSGSEIPIRYEVAGMGQFYVRYHF